MFDYNIHGRVIPDHPPSSVPQIKVQDESLRNLISARRSAGAIDLASDTAPQPPAIFVRDEGTAVAAYTAEGAEALIQKETARKWEELHEEEREKWKKRLIEAGHWALEEGEGVLEGVFFSQIGGIIADAVLR
jgi:glycyl-tRNA synthetase